MLHKYKLATLLILLFSSVARAGDEPAKEERKVTVEKNGSFVLYFNDNSIPKTVSVNGKYFSDKKEYLIYFNGKQDSIVTYAPLRYEYLRARINEIASDKWSISTGITTTSMNNIYPWIYDLNIEKDEAPESGTMTFRRYIMVLPNETSHELFTGYTSRTEKIADYDKMVIPKYDRYIVYEKKLDSAMAKLTRRIDPDDLRIDKIRDSLYALPAKDTTSIAGMRARLYSMRSDSTAIAALRTSYTHKDSLGFYDATSKLSDATIKDKLNKLADSFIRFRDEYINEKQKWERCQVYKIKEVCLQFERGFLENIRVTVDIQGQEEIFENIYSIGFSSKYNYKQFHRINLFARKYTINGDRAYIILADIIDNYFNFLDNYTRDYSPADTALCISPETTHQAVLHKDKLVNLFDSKIYTDLVGTNDNAPNGLVQIEVLKRVNLRTVRSQISSANGSYGWLNYLNLWGAITKIENKERFLFMKNNNDIQNGKIVSPNYATTLDLYRYENLSLGVEANAFLIDLPNTKVTYYLDLGGRFGRTPAKIISRGIDPQQDTLLALRAGDTVSAIPAYTFTVYPKISVEILPERRFSARFSYQLQHTWMLSNNQFKQVASYGKSETSLLPIEKNAYWTHMIELFTRIETSKQERSRIFARARFYIQKGDINTFFPQLQLGYAYDLFFRK